MKYMKKPIVIEAIQYDGDNFKDVKAFTEGRVYKGTYNTVSVPTLGGILRAKKGDYIVKGIENELYPIRGDIFVKTYEVVEE